MEFIHVYINISFNYDQSSSDKEEEEEEYLLVVWRHSFSRRSLSTIAPMPGQDGPLICRAVEPLFAVCAGTANSSFDTF